MLSNPAIVVTAETIFVNGRPSPASTLDIIEMLVRPHKTLKINIEELLRAMADIPDILSGINNKQARDTIVKIRNRADVSADVSAISLDVSASTPKNKKKNKKKKQQQEQQQQQNATGYETAGEDSANASSLFHDVLPEDILQDIPQDIPQVIPQDQKGSGRKRSKWLTLF